MQKIINMIKKTTLFIFIATIFASCYYDNLAELQPVINSSQCDTASTVTYSNHVKTILDDNCNSCHATGVAYGSVTLDTYGGVKSAAQSGHLLGAIKHETTYSPMPKNGNKLSDCKIGQIEKWINAGTLNN